MRDRAFEDQMQWASCLVVVIAAIAAWNTLHLSWSRRPVRLRRPAPRGLSSCAWLAHAQEDHMKPAWKVRRSVVARHVGGAAC
jgi:hypothetical protein